jgi:hypothetical protein
MQKLHMQQRVVEAKGLGFATDMNRLVSGDFAGAVPVLRKIKSAEDVDALAVSAHGYSYLGCGRVRKLMRPPPSCQRIFIKVIRDPARLVTVDR